jgi:hypothetical protein
MSTQKVLGLNLAATSLPDAIAAMVEAWYEAQNVEENNATNILDDPWYNTLKEYMTLSTKLPLTLSDIYVYLGVSISGKTSWASKRIKAIAAEIGWQYTNRRPQKHEMQYVHMQGSFQGFWPLLSRSPIDDQPSLTLAECCQRWGVSSNNTIKARAAAIGVKLIRESSTRTVWPGSAVSLGDELEKHLRQPGGTLRNLPPSLSLSSAAS